MHSINKNLLKC